MKKIIRSILVPVILSILVGYILGHYIYITYNDNLYNNLRSSRLYLIENGEYETIDAMREENSQNNYIYYKDDNKYKSVIGITRNYDNIDKIKDLYTTDLSVYEYYVPNDILSDKQEEYDKELSNITDINDVRQVVDNILALYRSDDGIKLIAIN